MENNDFDLIENIREWLSLLENTIYGVDGECPTKFEKYFCDGNQLTNIKFDSRRVHFVYMKSNGETVDDFVDFDKFEEWLDLGE